MADSSCGSTLPPSGRHRMRWARAQRQRLAKPLWASVRWGERATGFADHLIAEISYHRTEVASREESKLC